MNTVNMILQEYPFQILYSKDVRGKIKTWEIKVEKYLNYSVIVIVYGYNNRVESRRQINSGKNKNKVNETTHYTQAILEAQSKWNKKKDLEDYYTNELKDLDFKTKELDLEIKQLQTRKLDLQIRKDDLKTKELIDLETKQIVIDIDKLKIGKSVNNIDKNPLPMLASDYKKNKDKVTKLLNESKIMIQTKIDGFRMIYNTTTKQITTRQGKEYSIVKESGKLYEELLTLPKGLILDGELYTNKVDFEVLGVLRKTKKLTKDELLNLTKIEYHIYDLIDIDLTFEKRNQVIKDLFLNKKYEKLIYVDTYLVSSNDEIKDYHLKFLENGFEGTMIRNKDSFYKIKHRSNDLLKYKDFEDAEFKIVDYVLEKDTSGKDENLVVWVINIPLENNSNGNSFIKCKVRPKGTKEERKELYKKCVENFDQFKNKNLWVKYFQKTKDGNLRFPTTLRESYTEYIRNDII